MTNSQDKNSESASIQYIISENKVFSTKNIEMKIISTIPKIQISEELEILEDNKKIMGLFEELNKNKTTVKIYPEIKNFENVKIKIEKLFKENKDLFKEADPTDYDFIEKTSQIEILKQIINKIEDSNDFNIFESQVLKYCRSNEKREKEKNTRLSKKKEHLDERLSNIKKKIKSSESDLKILQTKKAQLDNTNAKLASERNQLEKEIGEDLSQSKIRQEIEQLKQSISKLEFDIEEKKLDIKLLRAKIDGLNSQKSLGSKKNPNLKSMIFTLGLIYWTKFSDIDYQKKILQNKISKKQEKIIELERSIHKTKSKIEMKKYDELSYLKKKNVSDEKTIKRISEIMEKEKKTQEEIHKIQKEINAQLKEKTSLDDKFKEIITEYEPIKKEIEDLKINSVKNIYRTFENINEQRTKNIDTLNEILRKVQNQKVSIKGNYIVSIT